MGGVSVTRCRFSEVVIGCIIPEKKHGENGVVIMSQQQNKIDKAVAILRQGGLVAFATETVYGLGGDAKNPGAIKKIFAIKQRPLIKPLNILIADSSQLSYWASEIPEYAFKLAKAFWPGPLTIIFKKKPSVSDVITAGKNTIGLRVPQHPDALQLLKQFGSGLAAPSANRYGQLSPTTAAAVQEELGDAVDLILDGGQCDLGMESTILDLSGDTPIVLRSGMITTKQIENLLGQPILSVENNSQYTPKTPIRLINGEQMDDFLKNMTADELPVAVLSHRNFQKIKLPNVDWINMPANPLEYAHKLYNTLRELDKNNYKQIVIEAVPATDEWKVIGDRLKKMVFSSS